jgi:transcriptional regulator with XRE-family HTH domain
MHMSATEEPGTMADSTLAPTVVCSRPDVQDALASGNWSIVLRAFLDEGLSQTAIAARTGLSQSQVSRLASGRSATPGMKTVKALCDGLGVPRKFAGLLDDASQEDDTDRRQFLSGSLGVLSAAAIPGTDLRDEQLLIATTLAYRQLEQRTAARSLIQPVSAHLALTCDFARRAEGRQRTRLSAAVAEVAGLAAWLHADLADPGQARRFYHVSMSAARQAQQPLLAIYMLGSFGQYATLAGDPAYGLRLLRDAAGRLPHRAPAAARAWLASLEAVALSYLGDRAALKAVDDAQRHADASATAEPVWPWVFKFGVDKVAGYKAVAASRLGLAKVAAEAFAHAEAARSPKQAALVAVEHARALATGGELEEGLALAVTAYDIGCGYESERVCQAVRGFRSSLSGRAGNRLTGELDDRLHRAYTPRTR